MLDEDFDGLIYNEKGDRLDQEQAATYVFYNLDKIGTYGVWRPSKQIDETQKKYQ